MGKIKKFIEEQKSDIRTLFLNYILTLISVAMLTIVFFINLQIEKHLNLIDNMMLFLCTFIFGNLFIETYFVNNDDNKKKPVIFYIINAIFSLIWTLIGYYDNNIANLFDFPDLYFLNIYKLFTVYLMTLLFLTIYKLVKKSGLSFDTYLARVVFGLLKTWGLFFVMYLAITMLLSIFDSLIMNIDYWDAFESIAVLLCGFVCFPYSLIAFTDTKEDNSKFTKGLINFALMPVVIIAFLIIYLYIIKILLNWNIPSNEAFEICLNLFIFGAPVWYFSYGFIKKNAELKSEELNLYGKIVKNIKYAYIPFIILEIISIGIRIYNYGLTEQRYLAVAAIVFQILYVFWDIIQKLLKKDIKDETLILVALFIIIFICICPGLNVDKLPVIIQQARFEEAIENEKYADASEAYFYLKYTDYGEKYLAEKFSLKEREEYEKIFYECEDESEQNSYKYNKHYYISVPYDKKLNGINISGYTNLYPFVFNGEYDRVYSEYELENFTIKYENNSAVLNVDITSIIEFTKDNSDTYGSSQSMDYQYIKLSDNCCVIVESMNFKYNSYSEEIRDLYIEGYVLINEGGHNGQ